MLDWVMVTLAAVVALMSAGLGFALGLDRGKNLGLKHGYVHGYEDGLYESQVTCGICGRKDAGCVPDPGHWLCKGHMPRSARTHVAFDERGKG